MIDVMKFQWRGYKAATSASGRLGGRLLTSNLHTWSPPVRTGERKLRWHQLCLLDNQGDQSDH